MNKTKLFLAAVLAGSLLVSGCASKREPMEFSGEANNKTIAQIRNAAIQAAQSAVRIMVPCATSTVHAVYTAGSTSKWATADCPSSGSMAALPR